VFPAIATVLVFLSLLSIPVSVVFALQREDRWRGRVVVYWLFGYARFSLHLSRFRKKRGRKRRLLRRSAGLIAQQRRPVYAMLRSEGFPRRMLILMRDMFRALSPRRFRLQCVMGLDDPADTGRLMGVLAPFRAFAGRISMGRKANFSVQLTPDFSGPCFTGLCHASVRFVPLRLIGIFLGFLISVPVLRAMGRSLQAHRKEARAGR
jgi:hypothetical protein